jgi:hypothetical protein
MHGVHFHAHHIPRCRCCGRKTCVCGVYPILIGLLIPRLLETLHKRLGARRTANLRATW